MEHLVGLLFCVGQKRVALLFGGLCFGVHIGGRSADGKQILIRRGLRGLQNAADLHGGLRDGAGVFDVQLLFVQRGLELFDLRSVLLILLLKLIDDVDKLHPAQMLQFLVCHGFAPTLYIRSPRTENRGCMTVW